MDTLCMLAGSSTQSNLLCATLNSCSWCAMCEQVPSSILPIEATFTLIKKAKKTLTTPITYQNSPHFEKIYTSKSYFIEP